MTQPSGTSKRGRPGAPGTDRAESENTDTSTKSRGRTGPRIGPLLAAPPPIVFRKPDRLEPGLDAPTVAYSVLPSARGDSQAALELAAERGTRIPALSVICCVTGVSLAEIAPMTLEAPILIRFSVPDVPGSIRLQAADPAETAIQIQHPPARTRSFGVERVHARRVTLPKLPPMAGFRRRS